MTPESYFTHPQSVPQKQYEALRNYFADNEKAEVVAKKFGYTYRGFTTIVSSFRKRLKNYSSADPFFQPRSKGRIKSVSVGELREMVIDLRKRYYSVEDIKVVLDSRGLSASKKTIYRILKEKGLSRLPRRIKMAKTQLAHPGIQATKSEILNFEEEEFKSTLAGVTALLPYIVHYGIRKAIEQSTYPQTQTINRLSSILSFVALKVSEISRYTADDLWCKGRGEWQFSTLNVLPMAAWFTAYSHRITKEMNGDFLAALHKIWKQRGLLGDTVNLNFITVPCRGEAAHSEDNWAGKGSREFLSMRAVLAHDPDTGIIDYGNTGVKHNNENAVVLEFLDFYYKDSSKQVHSLKYLVFDGKFTNYENLNKLNKQEIKFLTIRRRGKNLVNRLNTLASGEWKTIRVEASGNKKRTLKVLDEQVNLPGYEGKLRQISISSNGIIKPTIIITNDMVLSAQQIVKKYAQRWMEEKTISEQIEFCYLRSTKTLI